MAHARVRFVLVCAACGVLVAGGLYWLALMFGDDVEFRRDDLAYHVLVGSAAGSFPIVGATPDTVLYRYTPQDGPAPARLTLRFSSGLSPESVLRAYEAACRERDYAKVAADGALGIDAPLACVGDGHRIAIGVAPETSGSRVAIEFEEQPS